MADTGNPWFIPFAEPSSLVRDWPALSSAVGTAVAAGLSAAGGLVAVKHAIFTGTQTNSTASGANFAVTNLSITHEVANPANKLIISAFFGGAASSAGSGNVGLAIDDGTSLIGIATAAGSRTLTMAGGRMDVSTANYVYTMPSVTFVHEPGSGEKTYTVRAINITGATETIFINRRENDTDAAGSTRQSSGFVIQEVKV